MIKTERVVEILGEERELLLSFESVTQEMLTCRTEQLEEKMGVRQQLLEKIQGLEGELEELCEAAGEAGAEMLRAARGAGEPSAMSGALLEVYEKGMGVRTVLSRFPESEVQAMMRLRLEQEKVLLRIKAANQGSAAKAARFYSAGAAQSGSSRLGKA